ncbi:competence type IV pilus minor pilin ComGD [Alkalihalobacillus sp. BA299]|uniref:competence type IV pilus minor pilin ComGD n=1 Tax=Alkalihalobacillus sp. BA299 TaxID=2815938 RepID=UPI001ADA3AAA|nr:competence type IV pilus minor pilin ComGD [Alkalihalobacillus sp. BA299]
MKISKQGYTLIELLIVLTIISIVGSVTLIFLHSSYSSYERNQLVSQLENDLYYTQQLAISNGTPSVFYINTSKSIYGVKQNNQLIYEQPFNLNVTFERGSLGIDDIKFLSNGNISKSGTLFMYVENQRYAIVFLLGKGRFYIEER